MKIGFSKDLLKRIKKIQSNSPEKLNLIAYVKGNFEKELHDQFDEYKIHGEWYKSAPEILFTIIKLLMREIHDN